MTKEIAHATEATTVNVAEQSTAVLDINYKLVSKEMVELNEESVPEFILTISTQKNLRGEIKNVLQFEKKWIGKDTFNPDPRLQEEPKIATTKLSYLVNDLDRLDNFLLTVNANTPANKIGAKLEFKGDGNDEYSLTAKGVLTPID
jgi:hypothetical protein